MQKKNIFNKKDDINFDDDLFGKGLGTELEDDSSFDISVGESDNNQKKFHQPAQNLDKNKFKHNNQNQTQEINKLTEELGMDLDFLKDDFVDNINPSMTLEIIGERLEGSMNGSDWWRFHKVIE